VRNNGLPTASAISQLTPSRRRVPAHRLADLLHLPSPVFPALAASKGTSTVLVLDNANPFSRGGIEDIPLGGMWEDDEQRRFYEDLPDLAELVPAGLLGVEAKDQETDKLDGDAQARVAEEEREREMMEQVKRELEGFETGSAAGTASEAEAGGSKTAGESRLASPKAEPTELSVPTLALCTP
jgi:regulator of nonsense transcripts 2